MRVVLDTHVLVAALISPHHPPDRVFQAWLAGVFTLVTSREQLDEFRRVTRYPRLRPLIEPTAAGTMLTTLAAVAIVLEKLPAVDRSRDPGDNFVLAMAEAGEADYLVTGDRNDLLALKRHHRTYIVRVREFLKALGLERP
jgi:putative PIN family toxin of toxin-antitoxin system